MSQIPIELSNLAPGQRALVEVEITDSTDGSSDVICVVSRVQKESREEYFKIHSIRFIEDKRKCQTTPYGEIIDITTINDLIKS